jgi:hypothetical protein
LDRFVLVRVIDMSDVDIANIQFDYDLVFAVMFMNGNGRIYSRYGGRSPWNSESRVSLAGLQYTMRLVLQDHVPTLQRKTPPVPSVLARQLPSSRRSCMHCHEVWEGLRRRAKQQGEFDPRSLFVYPRPENIGLTLNVDAGNVIERVKKDSVCDRVGLGPGDTIVQIGGHGVYSQADVSWALHNAPNQGQIPLQFKREGKSAVVLLRVEKNWKETSLSWRASMRKEEVSQRQ